MKKLYSTPTLFVARLDNDDIVATSNPRVSTKDADDSAQLGSGRDGNPIWD